MKITHVLFKCIQILTGVHFHTKCTCWVELNSEKKPELVTQSPLLVQYLYRYK